MHRLPCPQDGTKTRGQSDVYMIEDDIQKFT